MATAITLYQAQDGTKFDNEAAANAHDAMLANKVEIDTFVAKHFPAKEGAKKKNPHAATAAKAIALWLGNK